jgi:acetyltransferase-like isoleucine patch superfamily enzyme
MELIIRIAGGVASRLRIFFYRCRGVKFDGRCWLKQVEIPRQHKAIRLGDDAALDRGIVLLAVGPPRKEYKIIIGARTYINRHTIIDAAERVEIGTETGIGPFCYITDHDHTFGNDDRITSGELASEPTRIGVRCWIGAHVTILKGVSIGDGAVIGAGAVVTKSIPARAIAAGNHAQVIKERP